MEMEALDTLFFRDGRPFTKGEDTWADGVFPPAPSVFYGALRSIYFSHHISELPKAQQKDDPTGNLKIKGVYLKLWDDICLPMPLDCVAVKGDSGSREALLLSLEKKHLVTSIATPYLLIPNFGRQVNVEEISGGYLDIFSFQEYLNLETREFIYRSISDHLLSEPKVGMARDRITRSSQDTMLYRVDLQRFNNGVLVVDYFGLTLPATGLAKLGAEGKGVAFWHGDEFTISAPELKGNKFKLYFATPAIFKQGWLPSWIEEDTLKGEYKGLEFRLLTAAVGRYLSLGGFDMQKKKPKPMQRAVPAGSVYYMELLKGDMKKVVDVFHGKNISEDLANQGFGLTYVGVVQ